ncbi:MAG: MFS transporter [Chloroflexota bacterium]|nr:MFS transporter [Chloroflexota bacterium]
MSQIAVEMVSEEVRRGRNRLAITVVLGHAIKHIYNAGMHSVLLAVMKDDLGLSGAQFGLLTTSGRVTSGATTMVAGYLGDRFANRSGVMLMISLGMMGISYFLLGNAPNYWLMLAAMLLVGIGPSLYHSPAIASLSRKFPDKRSFAISWHGTGGSVGEFVGPVLTGALLSGVYFVAFEWNEVLQISAGPALIFGLLIYLMMRGIPAGSTDTESLREYFSKLFTMLRRRGMQMLVITTALRSMGQGAMMAFLPVYLLEDQGISAIVIGLFMAGIQFVGILAQPVMGWLADRLGHKAVLVPCTAALGVLMIALKYAPTDDPLLFNLVLLEIAVPGIQFGIIALAMGAFLYALHAIYIAAAMDVAEGEAQSTVVSLIYGASLLGAFSPFLAGVIVDLGTTSDSFIYGGISVIAAAALLALTRLPRVMRG